MASSEPATRPYSPAFNGPDAPTDDDLSTCVHCGLCLNYCPTYRVTGLETESPRGRISLMAAWKDGSLEFDKELARHIDLCLGCRTCEAVCPSGVPYGRIIEGGRSEVERLRPATGRRAVARVALRQLLGHPRRLSQLSRLARGAQLAGLTELLPAGRQLPKLRAPFRSPPGDVAPAIGERRATVAFLTGCVMPVMYAQAHRASVRLLQLAGCEVWFPPQQRCCGALFAHNGDLSFARIMRQRNEAAFAQREYDALVVNSAGCGSHLKDFYPGLGHKVRDLFELLAELGLPPARRALPLRVTYQDPCHLAHAQRIRRQPRQLMSAIPELQLIEMPHSDICCGSAGIYNLLEPKMSGRILDEKLTELQSVQAQLVLTANPGCAMQLAAGLKARGIATPVRHLAELLAAAYQ